LDEKEYAVMKTHVDHGGDIVQRSTWLQEAADVVSAHHEKFDGGGYPKGMKSEEIPLSARIFAIADVFDALNSRRPYKKPLSLQETMQILEQGKGSHFDPRLLDLFASLAPALYREFSDQEGEPLKTALEEITRKYFSAGLETLTY
ncbi:MAG: HD domain-containing protein, partial [Desulfatitalea sp.]|nr:HD domain-containing protein [Desulfatitalea sp.]